MVDRPELLCAVIGYKSGGGILMFEQTSGVQNRGLLFKNEGSSSSVR